MFKYNAGWANHINANAIGFGLTDSNLNRISNKDDLNPVVVRANEIGVQGHFCIFYAGIKQCEKELSVAEFQPWLGRAFEELEKLGVKEPEGNLPVVNLYDEHILVIPLSIGDTPLYAIGLTDRAMENMRSGKIIRYRTRMFEKKGDQIKEASYELILFSRPVLENFEIEFMQMIGPNTKVKIT